MAMTASRVHCRTAGPFMAGALAFAARTCALAALCIASALFAVPKAEADIVVRFFDTGSNESAAEVSGSFDFSGYGYTNQTITNVIGAEAAGNRGVSFWIVATGGSSRRYSPPQINVERKVVSAYNGIKTLQSNLGNFSGDFRISVQYKVGGVIGEWNIGVGDAYVSNDIASFSGQRVTFKKSLQDLLGDTDFHSEFIFGTQKVIYTTKMPPARPAGLTATPGNAQVTLKWNDQSNDANIDKWQYRQRPDTSSSWGAWTDVPNSDKSTTSFERDRLTNGTTYRFQIRAVNAGFDGAESDAVTATPADAPAKPMTLTATPGARRVTLSWTLAADASIERWQYQKLEGTAANAAAFANVAWTPIPGSNAATRSHTVRGLEGEVAYSFRVRAIGYGGDGAESDIATATPTPGPSVEEQRRVLKHTLAAVAQATLAGAADTIGQRFDAAPGARSLTLAGQRVGSADRSPEAEAGATGPGAGVASDPRIAGGGARDDFGRRVGNSSYGVDGDALLRGSAFTLSLAGKEAGAGGPDWTVWGRTDWRAFEGRRSGDRWDGSQWTGWLGMDGKLNRRLTAGVAVSHGESETDYRLDDEFEGRLKTTLTALWPYLQMKTGNGGAVRVVLGAGTGEAEHRAFDGTVEREDLTMLAGSVSGRMPVARRSAFTLSAIGGASLAQIETDGSSSTSLGGLTATSWRLRAGMEAEHDGFALSSGSDWQVRPRGAVALRQDGGDGVTGTGMEVSGGVRLSKPGSRFGLDASGHWLALHSASGTREWGASLEVRLNPAAGGRGLSLALGPSWGQQQDGALARERLFDRERHETPQRLSLTARAGYGFAAAGGLLTPFADMALSGESRTQHYRTGIGFARGGIDAALTAGHRTGGTPDTRIGMDLRLRY